MTTSQLNARLLQILGLSAESAAVVMEEIDRLNTELELGRETEARLNERIRVLSETLNGSQRATDLAHAVWEGVDTHVTSHPDFVLGPSAPETALAWLRERDALKSQLAALGSDPRAVFKYPGGFKCCSRCPHPSECEAGCPIVPETPKKSPIFVRCLNCDLAQCGPQNGCYAQTHMKGVRPVAKD